MNETHLLILDDSKTYLPENSFAIYQVKNGEAYRLLRFTSLDSLQKDALRFREQLHNETVKLWNEVFTDKPSVEALLQKDGFHIIPSEDSQRITVHDEYMHTSDFCLGFGDRCCWVEGCDTRTLDTLVHVDSYDRVYVGQIPDEKKNHPEQFLNELFAQFNSSYADGYTGRSMSVSDVITFNLNGKITSYYVEPIGFQEIKDFLPPVNYLKNAEIALEDDFDMIDGIINNGDKKSVREEMNEYRNMIEAYVRPFPRNGNKDHSDLEH